MDTYSTFFDNHVAGVIRGFFAFAVAIDLLFVYARIFDRELAQRFARRFFGMLSGEPVAIAPFAEQTSPWHWLVFIFVSAAPPAAWICFEVYVRRCRMTFCIGPPRRKPVSVSFSPVDRRNSVLE